MINDIKRILTMLEKAESRLARQCYHDPKQCPGVFSEIEECIDTIRSWINGKEIFQSLEYFYAALASVIDELGSLLSQLWDICKPVKGKKGIAAKYRDGQKRGIYNSICAMMKNIIEKIGKMKSNDNIIGFAFEIGVLKSFDKSIIENVKRKITNLISKRGEQTYVFPCNDIDGYHDYVKDSKRFRLEVLNNLDKYGHHTGHKSTCNGPKEYILFGFRKNPRKTIMSGGEQKIFPIRIIQCKTCKQKFSLVPSFLPREKNFGIEIIGHAYRSLYRFNQSIQGVIESLKIIGSKSVKSKQTILNWSRWVGSLHPATILTRAGVNGSQDICKKMRDSKKNQI